MPQEELWTRTGLQLPRLRQALVLFGRALLLRCPNCGARHVLRHWFKLLDRCEVCGLRFERGEHDYFTGSILFGYMLAGVLFVAGMATIVIVTWPNVPWNVLQIVAPILIVVGVVALFPFSKLIWLAFDLMLRPVTPAELEWHRSEAEEWSTDETK